MEISAENSGGHNLNRAEKDAAVPPVAGRNLDTDKTLEQITRSAQQLTGASGAALALSDGEVIVCRSCSGYLSPPVGTQLNTETGLTAACVQTAAVVRSDDTHADPRVDRTKCVGVRSFLAVPVFHDPQVAGVLEVLSSQPNRFTDKHVTALQLLARLVETHVNYTSRNHGPLGPLEAKPISNDSAAENTVGRRVGCLSCGHRNPQDSQFCNRCGVFLCSSLESLELAHNFTLPAATDPTTNDGLREIYRLIAGTSGLATWNDIYAKLLAGQQNPSAPDQPHAASTREATKGEDPAKKTSRSEANNEFTAGAGLHNRRRVWP
jgi:hypothetical protein